MKKLRLLSISLCTLFCLSVNSQVSIGLEASPRQGVLLDLRQNEDGSSSMGMMLPRVELTSKTNLFPMFEPDGDGYLDANKEEEDKKHVGLIVYNMNERDLCKPHSSTLDRGAIIWDGEQWLSLNETMGDSKILALGVIEYKDQDGNKFLAGSFGKAGVWMLENLRATKFDPVRTSSDRKIPKPLTIVEQKVNTLTPEAYSEPYVTYPESKELFDANPNFGLFYNWAASTNGKGGDDGKKEFDDEAGTHNGTESGNDNVINQIQGICPSGWHLPSDKEWTDLELAIIRSTPKYITSWEGVTDDHGNPAKEHLDLDGSILENAGIEVDYSNGFSFTAMVSRGALHGSAMMLPCSMNGEQKRASRLPHQGGFGVILVGHVTELASSYGKDAVFASSSSKKEGNWVKEGEESITRKFEAKSAKVVRAFGLRSEGLSVRCKRNE